MREKAIRIEWFHHYIDEFGTVVRVRSRRQPSLASRSKSGTWVIREWRAGQWRMPAMPEISWGALSKMTYLGRTPA